MRPDFAAKPLSRVAGEGGERSEPGEGLRNPAITTLTPALSQRERENCFLGLPIARAKQAVGCDLCRHTGYRGRLAVAEMLPPLTGELNRAILARRDSAELARVAAGGGMTTVFQRACSAVEAGLTDPSEVRRVFGFVDETTPPG